MTAEIDVTTMQAIESAAAAVDGSPESAARLKAALVGHARFKQPQFMAFGEISGVGRNSTGGTIELRGTDETIKVRVPKREQLAEIGDDLVAAITAARAS